MLLTVESEHDTEALGRRIAAAVGGGAVIALRGPLGAGKTTLVRAIARALGVTGSVKSPTYTLVESYDVPGLVIHHFDLYRLNDPGELEDIGLRDYFAPGALCLVEWPEHGAGLMPEADLQVDIESAGGAREIRLQAATASGRRLLEGIAKGRSSMA